LTTQAWLQEETTKNGARNFSEILKKMPTRDNHQLRPGTTLSDKLGSIRGSQAVAASKATREAEISGAFGKSIIMRLAEYSTYFFPAPGVPSDR
jgi:hypothetical protein